MRVKGLLDNTMGTIVIGGETDEATKFIAPTVVRDVHGGDVLMSEYVSCSFNIVEYFSKLWNAEKFLDRCCLSFL